MDGGEGVARKKPRGKPVEFNRDSLKDWVTGFRKRKQARREVAAIQNARKARAERSAARKERRDALKLKDRLTGAFGEKRADDSDDELGEAAQNPEQFAREQQEERAQERAATAAARERHASSKRAREQPPSPPPAPVEAVAEDEEALVTVVTRDASSDEEEEEIGSEEEEYTTEAGRAAAAAARAMYAKGGGGMDAREIQAAKARQALKKKDSQAKKGIKGGHKFKRAKIASKKQKTQKKKGANRER